LQIGSGDGTISAVRSPADLTAAFRAQGLKITPQRQLLFRLLDGNDQHPSAEALFHQAADEMPGISLRTVYQTLNDLADMGELRQVSVGCGPSRFDPNTSDHHHVICDRCGTVRDVYVSGADNLAIEGLDGFAAVTPSIVFHGECTVCARPEPNNNHSPKEH
jgi:Fur family peroxide stress response transcriptional regulator